MINDRMTRGIIAGASGALVQNVYMLLAKSLDLTDIMYVDVARHFIFTQPYDGFLAVFVALLAHFTIDSFWGVVFAFLIEHTSSRFYMLKGFAFGTSIWFFIRVFGTKIFGVVPGSPPLTALVFFVGAVLFGLTIAIVLRLFDDSKIVGG